MIKVGSEQVKQTQRRGMARKAWREMRFALIILIMGGASYRPALTTISFPSAMACQNAAEKVRHDMSGGYVESVTTSCVALDDMTKKK